MATVKVMMALRGAITMKKEKLNQLETDSQM